MASVLSYKFVSGFGGSGYRCREPLGGVPDVARPQAHCHAAERVLEHRWRTGDVVFWDNIALQHARGDLGGVGRRVLQRVIVGTEGVAPHVGVKAA